MWRERTGDGEEEEGAKNGLVKHVTVVKYYGKKTNYITVLCVCVSLILSLSIM